MSIKITLRDNSTQSLPIDFMQLSSSFKDDEVNHIHTTVEVFQKIKVFGEYYLNLNKKERKIFENPDLIWDKESETQNWCNEFLQMPYTNLIELSNESHTLNIKPLLDLCCYQISQIIKNKSVEEMRDLFDVKSDFTPEEEMKLKKDTEWIIN